MPSSLLPSRSARNSESISPSSFCFIASKFSRAASRNFFLASAAGFFVIGFALLVYLSDRVGHGRMQVVAERLVDSCTDKLTRLRIAGQEYGAVDFRRLSRCPSAEPGGASGHRAFDQHLH